MASKRSKKADQCLVSKAEFKKYKGSKAFAGGALALAQFIESGYLAHFGLRAYARLKETAKRVKQTPAGYLVNYLLK